MSEAIHSHLAQRFSREKAAADVLCEGEKSCERFQSQGGDGISHGEQEKAACTSCVKRHSKFRQVESNETRLLIAKIERIVDESRVQGKLKWKRLSPIEYEGILEYCRLNQLFMRAAASLPIMG